MSTYKPEKADAFRTGSAAAEETHRCQESTDADQTKGDRVKGRRHRLRPLLVARLGQRGHSWVVRGSTGVRQEVGQDKRVPVDSQPDAQAENRPTADL